MMKEDLFWNVWWQGLLDRWRDCKVRFEL